MFTKRENENKFKTRSSKRTKIAYFPVNLILKETLNRLSNDRRTENRTDRRKHFLNIGIWSHTLPKRNLKIGLLERHLTILSFCPSVCTNGWIDKKYKR